TPPFFSVIITTYNRKDFLPIALDSVLRQTYTDYELIIVDDGSTDTTRKAIEPLFDRKIKYIYQPHQGVSAARNRGIKASKGIYVNFLDSDDRYVQEKLKITANFIKRNPAYRLFHTEEIWYRNGALLPQKNYHHKPTGEVFRKALKRCCISISTVSIHRSVFSEIGLFDENLPACEDYDFWLRITAKIPVLLIPRHLTIKEGGHADQQSKKYPAMDKFRIYSIGKLLKSKELDAYQYALAYSELEDKCTIYEKGALKRKKTEERGYCKKILRELKP
ncbi:MAG: glycosyltransferase, partial [Candidatus Omnitrophica bacterium]|nr:glycosyltransferase [Candidatus Omnitrophota bacterium]MBD3268954.1 glycosyltransferase [Candidatus Omnitrophota bacterium]